MDLPVGTVIGGYRLLRKLGEGGMGAVYLAEHALMGRRAAIKFLLPQYATHADVVQRFFNEARAASLIDHPGMVTIFDFGHHIDGAAYIVMEFLKGESLRDCLRRTSVLPVPLARQIASQVVSALAAAHAEGIVHRDLKPDNILLVADREGTGSARAKVIDFGIAKLASAGTGAAVKTRTGAIMGTPLYMAPEQCRGAGDVDGRADIYSMGCILFEMVCGQPPFRGPGVGDVMMGHMLEPPPHPRSLAAQLPMPLCTVILRCLEKKPELRFQTMAELENALAATKDSSSIPPPAVEPSAGPLAAPAAGLTRAEISTTLSAAAGASLAGAPRGGGRWLPVTAVTVVVAGVAALFLFVRVGSGPAERAWIPPAPPAVQVDARPVAPPEPETATSVTIRSEPPGAHILRAADQSLLGTTPFTSTSLANETGTLELIVRLEGFVDAPLAIERGASGERTVVLRPVPTKVEVTIGSSPPGAAILFDDRVGRPVRTPLDVVLDSDAAPRAFVLRCPGYEDARGVLAPGQSRSFKLRRRPGTPLGSDCN